MKRKHKQIELYLFDSDIEKLNERYSTLYSKVKNDKDLSDEQLKKECDILLQKYDFEIEQLSALREPDYWKQQAQIKAKNKEQTPWRRCWLWRLFFLPLTNRAQDIIEREAELDAEAAFSPKEKELEDRADKLYANTGKILTRRQRKRALKKYLKYKRLLEADSADVTDEDVHDNTAEQLEEALHAADAAEPAEIFEQPEPAAIESAAPSFEAATAAHGASDGAQLSLNVEHVDVAEPPAPPVRKPRNNKR